MSKNKTPQMFLFWETDSEILQNIKEACTLENRWLVGFYGISTFVGYLTPNPFLYK